MDKKGQTPCVFCLTPEGWGWLPVAELPAGSGIEGEWVSNDALMPSDPAVTNDRDDGDELTPLGPFLRWRSGQIPADRIKHLLLAQCPVGADVEGDSLFQILPDVAHRR